MKALFIGKYPPIEGGVASHTYWLARGLGASGVKVAMVTNAGRVEEMYRQNLDLSKYNAVHCGHKHFTEYQPENVTVYSLDSEPPRHIPFSEGYVSRLVNLGLKAIDEHGADVIYSHYLEPYGVAGMVLQNLTGLPHVVRHAGSDIYRLLRSPQYSLLLGRVLQRADGVIMSDSLRVLSESLGIENRRYSLAKRSLPDVFSPQGDKYKLPSELIKPENVPLITYLGKASSQKGVGELLTVLDSTDSDFRMLFVSKGPELASFKKQVADSVRLSKRVHFTDFVPPWEIPAILRSTDLLVHLENRFPVPIHSPGQPFEAIMCQTPMLLSGEMAKKMKYPFEKNADELFSVVQDPQVLGAFKNTLTETLTHLDKKKENAKQLHDAFSRVNNWEETVNTHIKLMEGVQTSGLRKLNPFRQ